MLYQIQRVPKLDANPYNHNTQCRSMFVGIRYTHTTTTWSRKSIPKKNIDNTCFVIVVKWVKFKRSGNMSCITNIIIKEIVYLRMFFPCKCSSLYWYMIRKSKHIFLFHLWQLSKRSHYSKSYIIIHTRTIWREEILGNLLYVLKVSRL